jgi:hypothetical protein
MPEGLRIVSPGEFNDLIFLYLNGPEFVDRTCHVIFEKPLFSGYIR